MRILIVAATAFEVAGLQEFTQANHRHDIQVLITGPGMVQTTWALGSLLNGQHQKFDLAINAGIAGSFDPELKNGTVVNVLSDVFADFGAEDNAGYLKAADIGLLDPDEFPFSAGRLHASSSYESYLDIFIKVSGITVNTVSGSDETIKRRLALFSSQVESMEGAAFLFCCLNFGLPCLQLRSVSNLVEIRNKKNWNIALAVKNLNIGLIHLIETISLAE